MRIESLLDKLEEIKQSSAYAISLHFGEDVGCDDLDVPIMERKIVCIWFPVGCLGETKMMFRGNVKNFLDFDVKSEPTTISNPPKKPEYEKDGLYLWGTEEGVSHIQKKRTTLKKDI